MHREVYTVRMSADGASEGLDRLRVVAVARNAARRAAPDAAFAGTWAAVDEVTALRTGLRRVVPGYTKSL